MIRETSQVPHQREPYRHLNHGTMDDLQYCNNPMLQQCIEPLLNAWPTQWSDSPL